MTTEHGPALVPNNQLRQGESKCRRLMRTVMSWPTRYRLSF